MKYVIVDIDGTVALHKMPDGTLLRGHHEYDRVGDDVPNEPVIELVRALTFTHSILWVSGRPERAREDTCQWLDDAMPWWVTDHSYDLFMREDGDYRADDIVKEEIFNNQILPRVQRKENILFAIDDRPRVIRMWERLGIYVIDVQPLSGEF